MRDGKVHRVTFSRSLADHVAGRTGASVQRLPVIVGRALERNEASRTGLYALTAARKGSVLRVALSKEEADLLCDYDSRRVHECWLGTSARSSGGRAL